MEYTKGPWEWQWACISGDIKEINLVNEDNIVLKANPDKLRDADMSLIAAAPELYEVLKDLLRDYRNKINITSGGIIQRAINALTAAEGGGVKCKTN